MGLRGQLVALDLGYKVGVVLGSPLVDIVGSAAVVGRWEGRIQPGMGMLADL